MPELERDIELNEDLVRALILRKDVLTDEVMNADTPATIAPAVVEGEEGAAPVAEGAAEVVAEAAPEAPAAEAAPAEEAGDKPKPDAPAAE